MRFLILIITTFCACGAFIQLRFGPVDPTLPSDWAFQLLLLLGLSVFLSALLFLFGSAAQAVAALVALRFFVLAVAVVPQGAHPGTLSILGSSYVLEVIYYLRVPYNRVLAAAAILSSVALLRPVRGWGMALSRFTVADLTMFWIVGTLLAVLADRHRQWVQRSRSRDAEIRRLEQAILQLTSANMGFQRYADTIQEKSAAEERNRITREIHDTVGYTLMNIMMMMQDASLMAGTVSGIGGLLEQTREQAQAGLNETRRALRLLRATEKRPIQTIEEIKRLVTAFQSSTGVTVATEYGNIPFSLRDDVNEFIFHMLQEGMANALRHGKATQIRVLFWLQEGELIVSLHDNGSGSVQTQEGIGLSGMRERIATLQGQLTAGNEPDGFQIVARIPYASSEGRP